jgi:hypothetical protein
MKYLVIRRFAAIAVLLSAVCLNFSSYAAGAQDQAQAVQPAVASQPKRVASAVAKPTANVSGDANSSRPAVTTPRRAKPNASAVGPYYVDFRARTAASYGHAFVWFGKTSEKAVEVAGLHPKGDEVPYILGHVTWVPAETGASYGDLDEEYLTANYRVYLTEAEAKRVFAYIKEIQASSKFWNAETNNCTSFIGKIASFMGLKTPFHLIFPEQYVKDLKEMNGGRQTAMLDPAP